jgi:hypothetical protein
VFHGIEKTCVINNNNIIIIYYIDIELQESANGNNHFSSKLWFTLTAHWSMASSSFALKLQTPETVHSEGTGIAVGGSVLR